MEDILASIRRILNEDEPAAPGAMPGGAPGTASGAAPPLNAAPMAPGATTARPASPEADDVLVLDASMMVEQPPPPPEAQSRPPTRPEIPVVAAPPVPAAAPALVAPEAAAGVASSLGSLVRTLSNERTTAVRRDGPTIEDLVREELRPLVKDWLDRHLPPLVERLVRAEIERVVGRVTS